MPQNSIRRIRIEKIVEKTARTGVSDKDFCDVFLTKVAMKHLKQGSVIINATSVIAYKDFYLTGQILHPKVARS